MLYPDFNDNLMMNFFPFGSVQVTGILVSYTRVDDDGNPESIVDSLFQISTDVTFFEGDYPETMLNTEYNLSSGRIHRIFINYDYGELPERAVLLQGNIIFPVDFGNSFYSVARPLKAIEMTPLINDADGNLTRATFLRQYYVEEANTEHDLWQLHEAYAGQFASEILQPIYNGIQVDPDSLFVKGYYLEIWGNMDDYSYLNMTSTKSSNKDMLPKIEVVYFIPPPSRF